jgi:hypothetical protein
VLEVDVLVVVEDFDVELPHAVQTDTATSAIAVVTGFILLSRLYPGYFAGFRTTS